MISIKTVLATIVISLLFTGCGSTDNEPADTNRTFEQSESNVSLGLNEDQKFSLAFMWHEEKLAYELYLELNKIYPSKKLENIANKSEIRHMEAVERLIEIYDINITNLKDYTIEYSASELSSMEVGKFAIESIQNLYDSLYAKGIRSAQDSFEVGCMVEVTDIIDLDRHIEEVQAKQDLVDTFVFLRKGSYNHYWVFDGALKGLGIDDGCCSLGTIDGVNYCHPEYPKK